jgi:hypothetical protein
MFMPPPAARSCVVGAQRVQGDQQNGQPVRLCTSIQAAPFGRRLVADPRVHHDAAQPGPDRLHRRVEALTGSDRCRRVSIALIPLGRPRQVRLVAGHQASRVGLTSPIVALKALPGLAVLDGDGSALLEELEDRLGPGIYRQR